MRQKDEKIKIFIADSSRLLRATLTALVRQEADFMVCGEADSSRATLIQLPAAKPDVVILDLSLGDMVGTNLIHAILQCMGSAAPSILVVSMRDENIHAEEALQAGAKGYLMKPSAAGKMVEAIRAVASGNIYVGNNLMRSTNSA